MKTFTKLLTIAGTVAFSGVCLISKADPKIMTLEELKLFLKNAKDDCVTYLEQNNAITVKTSDPAFKTKLERLNEADAERKKYSYPKFYGLDEFSRRVPTQVLKEYGIKTQRTEGYFDKEEVYEITFNSILSSTYFSEEERKKAKEQFLDYNAFTDAIDTYTKDVAILRNISVKVLTDDKTKKSEANDCSHEYTYKLSDDTLTQEQGWLNKHLKALGKRSKERAAIILLLLFDQKIPSEYRVQWISNTTANVYNFEYLELILKNFETNRINLEFGILDIMSYICYRFFPKGKTFDDYQWEFEEKFFEKTEEDNEEDKEEVHNDKSNIESDFRFCFILRKPQKLMTLEEAVEFLEKNKKSETHDGVVTKIEYSTDEYGRKIPTVIEGTDKEKIAYALNGSFKQNPKREKINPKQSSRILKKEDLLKRGLTDDEFKLLGDSSVRELTFESILENGCFSEEQKSKAKKWLEEPWDLTAAITHYLNNCTFIELVPVTAKNSKTGEIWYSGAQIFKASDALSKDLRDLFEWLFYDGFIKSKTAAEKMILLLLFDEITPPEYRLSWACSPTSSDTYEPFYNIINLPKVNSDEIAYQDRSLAALHEIGHYLDYQIGLFQDFKSWENPFAKKLLLLESEYEKNKQTISLPQSLFEDFVDYQWAANNPCTESDLFMRWQTFSRWGHVDELQNMLGICFAQDGKTIYLNALSEVRALKEHIHYGHNFPKEHETYRSQFKTQDEQAIFEKIVQEARNRKPDPKVLNLLCKLHKLAHEIKVFNFFDDDDNQEHSHTLQMVYD